MLAEPSNMDFGSDVIPFALQNGYHLQVLSCDCMLRVRIILWNSMVGNLAIYLGYYRSETQLQRLHFRNCNHSFWLFVWTVTIMDHITTSWTMVLFDSCFYPYLSIAGVFVRWLLGRHFHATKILWRKSSAGQEIPIFPTIYKCWRFHVHDAAHAATIQASGIVQCEYRAWRRPSFLVLAAWFCEPARTYLNVRRQGHVLHDLNVVTPTYLAETKTVCIYVCDSDWGVVDLRRLLGKWLTHCALGARLLYNGKPGLWHRGHFDHGGRGASNMCQRQRQTRPVGRGSTCGDRCKYRDQACHYWQECANWEECPHCKWVQGGKRRFSGSRLLDPIRYCGGTEERGDCWWICDINQWVCESLFFRVKCEVFLWGFVVEFSKFGACVVLGNKLTR